TVLDGTLELATFEVSAFRATKKSFNPENPSNLGKAEFAFSVSAPGKGSLEIANEKGTIIKNIDLPSFSTWNQHFYWEGTDNFDNSIPDGLYLVTLITSDEKAHTAKVYIDRSIHYPLSGSMHGTSSTGPVELSNLLPQGSFAFNFNVALTNAGPIPGITLSLGLPAHIEAGFRVGMLTNSEQKKEDYISVSLKKSISIEPFSTALLARFAYGSGEKPQATSGVTNGLAVGVATGFSTATYAFHGEFELLNGNSNGLPSTESFLLAGGLIARLFFGPLSTSLWTRYESGYFNSLFFNSANLMPGLSLHAIIPQTNLTLNIDLGYAITRQQQLFFLYTGFGVLF
ncbi:MAG TPA: FlgD immunoglobulin-like domain containing protein, partial [Treponemataceae bacterium]|nr:FlgD immunoglobulin-like domain containing protein [Treponemataceae bacterium]